MGSDSERSGRPQTARRLQRTYPQCPPVVVRDPLAASGPCQDRPQTSCALTSAVGRWRGTGRCRHHVLHQRQLPEIFRVAGNEDEGLWYARRVLGAREPEGYPRRNQSLQLEGSGARIGPGGTARVATDRMVVSGSSLARAPLPRGQHGMAYEASVLLKLRVCHPNADSSPADHLQPGDPMSAVRDVRLARNVMLVAPSSVMHVRRQALRIRRTGPVLYNRRPPGRRVGRRTPPYQAGKRSSDGRRSRRRA